VDAEVLDLARQALETRWGAEVLLISAATRQGLDALLNVIWEQLGIS
jgi:hypothetical protein